MSDFELKWNGDAFMFEANKVTKAQMWKAVFEVEKSAKQSFGRGASSLDGTRTRGKKKHRSSAPGFAPNIDRGILKSSVKGIVEDVRTGSGRDTEVVGLVGYDVVRVENELRAKGVKIRKVATAVNYGFFLEVGTKNMRPRPWLFPALVRSESEILNIFKRGIK